MKIDGIIEDLGYHILNSKVLALYRFSRGLVSLPDKD